MTMNSVSHLKLYDIASRDVLTVPPDTPLDEAVACFATRHLSSLVVVDQGQPVGIITESDLVRLMCLGAVDQRPVRTVMSTPLLTVPQDLDFSSAQMVMTNYAIRHLVLVDAEGRLSGLASETDFRRHLGSDLLSSIQNLGRVIDQGGKLIAPDESLAFALHSMVECALDYIVIGEAGRAQGILTERDVPVLLARHVAPATVPLSAVMSHPLSTVGLHTTVAEAARMMEQFSCRHLVVESADGFFVGVISQHRMLEKLAIALLGQSRLQLEDRMSMVLEATGIGTWEYDYGQNCLLRSAALNAMVHASVGASSESLERLLQRIDAPDRLALLEAFAALKSGTDEFFSVDCRFRGEDGLTRWISSRGKVVERDPAGKVLRSAGVAIDISAQKASEERLRQSEARFRQVVERIPLALGHISAQEDVLYINPYFEALFGYAREDLPTLATWFARAYPDDTYRAWVQQVWDEKLHFSQDAPGTLNPCEYCVTCKDGRQRIVEISGVCIGTEFLAIFLDVTERRQQQSLLEFGNAVLEHISRDTPVHDTLDLMIGLIEKDIPGSRCAIQLAASSENSPPVSGACCAAPILATSGTVLGTVTVFGVAAQSAGCDMVRSYVATATRLAAVAIENSQRETELQRRIDELRRWQEATLGREDRVMELKREVNALAARLGEGVRYHSVAGAEDAS